MEKNRLFFVSKDIIDPKENQNITLSEHWTIFHCYRYHTRYRVKKTESVTISEHLLRKDLIFEFETLGVQIIRPFQKQCGGVPGFENKRI